MLTLNHYLALSAILFSIGTAGFLMRRNVIVMFMSVELIMNAAALAFVAGSRFHGAMDGQVATFFVIAVAAAEAAVGLAIIVAVLKTRRTVNIDEISSLKH